MNRNHVKEIIKRWLLQVNEAEILPNDIEALNFGLFIDTDNCYQIYLTGSKKYDYYDDDWACIEDFIPKEEYCSPLGVSTDFDWEIFLNNIIEILKELVQEFKEMAIFRVHHITSGFDSGNLFVVK